MTEQETIFSELRGHLLAVIHDGIKAGRIKALTEREIDAIIGNVRKGHSQYPVEAFEAIVEAALDDHKEEVRLHGTYLRAYEMLLRVEGLERAAARPDHPEGR